MGICRPTNESFSTSTEGVIKLTPYNVIVYCCSIIYISVYKLLTWRLEVPETSDVRKFSGVLLLILVFKRQDYCFYSLGKNHETG